MAISHNINSNIVFSTELDIIYISGAADVLPVTISHKGIIVFAADYVPDSVGNVVIYNIKKVLEAYIENVFSDFTFTFGDKNVNVRVLRSAVRITETAEGFLPSFFLTTLINSKKTALGRYESLSFYPQESCNVYAVSYLNGDTIATYDVELMSADDVVLNAVNMVNVSPNRFTDDSKGTIVNIVLHAGKRLFTLEIDDMLPSADPAFIFRNNFGCWETFYLTGTKETEYSIKRSHAYIDGYYKQYDFEDTEIFNANSGILLGNMLSLGMDVARTTNVFLLDIQGAAGDEIVLTDSEIKYTNDDDALPTFDYTFRRCTVVTALLKTIRPSNLFDKTFDFTFN